MDAAVFGGCFLASHCLLQHSAGLSSHCSWSPAASTRKLVLTVPPPSCTQTPVFGRKCTSLLSALPSGNAHLSAGLFWGRTQSTYASGMLARLSPAVPPSLCLNTLAPGWFCRLLFEHPSHKCVSLECILNSDHKPSGT